MLKNVKPTVLSPPREVVNVKQNVLSPNTTLNKFGYSIPKKDLTEHQKNKLEADLFVEPKTNSDFEDGVKFKVYRETENDYIIPRYYGTTHFGPAKTIDHTYLPLKCQFTGKLRDYQIPVVKDIHEKILTTGGGVIKLPCAYGKTTMAIHEAVQLGGKTLIVVAKSFLMNQWIDRIKNTTTASIGIICQDVAEIKGKDFVVAMVQTLYTHNYPPELFKDFSCLIIDEAHHYSSRVFHTVFYNTAFKYTIALSATPKRADGLTKVLHWFVGDMLCNIEREKDSRVVVRSVLYESNNKNFTEKRIWSVKQKATVPCVPKMQSALAEIPERNVLIGNIIDILRQAKERKILVLGHRIEHLKLLKNIIDKRLADDIANKKIEKDEYKTYLYYSKTKGHERREAEEYSDILFATYAMADEGLDIPRLNTLVFVSPKTSIEQSVGRILRKLLEDGDITLPLIIDIIDNYSVFATWGKVRNKYFTKLQYFITKYFAFNDKVITERDYLKIKYNITDDILKTDYQHLVDYDTDLNKILTISDEEILKIETINKELKTKEKDVKDKKKKIEVVEDDGNLFDQL